MTDGIHALNGVFLARLGIATGLGLAIGFERQWRQRSAGLHTMTLVAVGAALFCQLPMLVGGISDPLRVAAQVVSGVGFLAGGVILRQGLNVRGLITAATLWATAAVGALVGSGFEMQGAVGAAVVITVNAIGQPLAAAISRIPRPAGEQFITAYVVRVRCAATARDEVRRCIHDYVRRTMLTLNALRGSAPADGFVQIEAELSKPGGDDGVVERLRERIAALDGVAAVTAETAEQVA